MTDFSSFMDSNFSFYHLVNMDHLHTLSSLIDSVTADQRIYVFETPDFITKKEYRDFLGLCPEKGSVFEYKNKYYRLLEVPCLIENINWDRNQCKVIFRAMKTTKSVYEKYMKENSERNIKLPILYHGRHRNLSNIT